MTGLALTVSQEWLRGASYSFLAILHAITVIAALLFLPFGKFFHIFQRPAQLGVKLYQEAGLKDPGATAPDAASGSPRECTSTISRRAARNSVSTTRCRDRPATGRHSARRASERRSPLPN